MPHIVTRANLYAPRPRPISEMNVTPFIDVLLVLLIVMILAIPVQVNVTPVDLPGERREPSLPVLDQNTITIDAADRLAWNGTPLTEGELVATLQQSLTLAVEPELQFEPEPLASYALSARVLNDIKGSGVTKFGFVGNDKYRNFGK